MGWNDKKALKEYLKKVEKIKKTNIWGYNNLNITAKIYKNTWKESLKEARATALLINNLPNRNSMNFN